VKAYYVKSKSSYYIATIVDSGCTTTLSGEKDCFYDLEPCNIKVKCADNKYITVKWRGTFRCSHNGTVVEIKNALYVPNVVTLISVDQLTAMGLLVLFDDKAVSFYRNRNDLVKDKPVLRSNRRIGEKLYTLNTKPLKAYNNNASKFKSFLTKISEECDPNVLHRRYDHAPLLILKKKFPHLQNVVSLDPCLTCIANQKRTAYSKSYTPDKGTAIETERIESEEALLTAKIEKILANFDSDDGEKRYGRYLMSDTKVLLNYPSIRGYRYLYVVVCRDTGVGEIFLGVDKNDFFDHMKTWLRTYYNRYQRFPAFWKFDSGTEFLNHETLAFFKQRGMEFLASTTKASNENPHSERKIGITWIGILRALTESSAPFHLW